MTPYLKQVAQHYFAKGNLDKSCFIFPNRRTIAFFMKELSELVKKESSVPVRMPEMYTINDFFYKLYNAPVSDKITLLLKLYDCYAELNPNAEPLDEFLFWGDVILSDFADVDKYLANPSHLFQNVAEFKEIQDDYSHLTPTQREAIEKFVSHFDKHSSKVTANIQSDKADMKQNFLSIWNILYPLYVNFNEVLEAEGIAYEGMVYRNIAEKMEQSSAVDVLKDCFPGTEKFIFVGLNALNECEKKVMGKMRDAHLAEFCWDYSSDMIKDKLNKSSFFMSENVVRFPQAFKPDTGGLPVPQFNVINIPSSVAQTKQVASIIKDKTPDDCAIVLPDETLLVPLLNSIPHDIKNINVTMGYPMSSSSFASLMSSVSAMQMHLRKKGDQWFFYRAQVRSIFSNDVFRRSLDSKGEEMVEKVIADAKFYIPASDLCGTDVMDALFRPVVQDVKARDKSQVNAIFDYLKNVTSTLASRVKDDADLAMEIEFARKYYQDIQLLQNNHLCVLPATVFKLINQVVAGESVPFEGEPLKGLQIMGPLETRALDFDTMIILSCNEGVFPRRSVNSSFIPPELRKGFSLPTYEFQDAVWAYYFYRMISRASNVWMLYDSRTEGTKTGEESRYIKQLQYHFGVDIKRYFAQADATLVTVENEIPKTEEDVEAIRKANLSASTLKNYLDCPAKFYYHTVKKLKSEDDATEDLDAGMIGNVYHATMQALYLGPVAMDPAFDMSDRRVKAMPTIGEVTIDYLSGWLKRRDDVKARVRSLILAELGIMEVVGRNLVAEEVIVTYVMQTIRKEIEYLKNQGLDRFTVLSLEKSYQWMLDGFKFYGYIDRLDSYHPGTARVVDYKTGNVEDNDIEITDENAADVVDALFGKDNKGRPKIAFQLYLYDMFVKNVEALSGHSLTNVIYPPAGLFNGDIKEAPVSEVFCEKVTARLSDMLKEMTDTTTGFRRTDQTDTCSYCDFKIICGRV